MASVVTLRALSDNSTITVDKENICEMFPDSFLAATLSLDPTAEVIDIPNKSIDGHVLFVLEHLLNSRNTSIKMPEGDRISRINFLEASNYLGIDVLMAMADPTFETLIDVFPEVNFLNLQDITRRYSGIRYFTAVNESKYISMYIDRMIPMPKLCTQDPTYPDFIKEYREINLLDRDSIRTRYASILDFTVVHNARGILTYLLTIMPVTDSRHRFAFNDAIHRGRTAIVEILISSGYQSDGWTMNLIGAITGRHYDMIPVFMSQPAIRDRLNWEELLRTAAYTDHVEVVDEILEHYDGAKWLHLEDISAVMRSHLKNKKGIIST